MCSRRCQSFVVTMCLIASGVAQSAPAVAQARLGHARTLASAASCPGRAGLQAIAKREDATHARGMVLSVLHKPACVAGWALAAYVDESHGVPGHVSLRVHAGAWHVVRSGAFEAVCLSIPVAKIARSAGCMGLDASQAKPPAAAVDGIWKVMRSNGHTDAKVGWTRGVVAPGSCFVPAGPGLDEHFLWTKDPTCEPQGSGGFPASKLTRAASSVGSLGRCAFVMVSADGKRFGCLS